MAAVGHSITAEAFALAVNDLPLENVYAKAAELQNSISHLLNSNVQMQPYADEGDSICRDAIRENNEVIKRMEERIDLCKAEVERRGMLWMAGSAGASNAKTESLPNGVNGHTEDSTSDPQPPPQSGRLTDEELRRRLEAQLDDDNEGGLHL